MLESAHILDAITVDPPVAMIYRRLGFRKQATQLTSAAQKETDQYIDEARSLIVLRGSFLRLAIDANNGQNLLLGGNISFESSKLAAFLGQCREAVLMGATAGSTIMDAIREKTHQHEMTAAVVYDATASEMADAALDWIADYINRQIRREGRSLLPRRFSAGYGDFKLENQKVIYEKLQMEKIGVAINAGCLLIPEKSVTAISGICSFN